MNTNGTGQTNGQGPVRCEDIRELLFDYMSRELGGGRSDLVHEHLRRCPACQAEAARIWETLELLARAAREQQGLPLRLSDERRALIVRAFMHPVLDWIYRHHVLVSVAVTALTIAVLSVVLWRVRPWRDRFVPVGPVITIGIGTNLPEQLPGLREAATNGTDATGAD